MDGARGVVPRVAVCVVGGVRSFPLPTIHESLRHHFLGRLHPPEYTDIFFGILPSSQEDQSCRDMEVKYPNHTLDLAMSKFHPVHVTVDTPTCQADAFVAESSCCRHSAERQKGAFHWEWRAWDSYIRKAGCLHQVQEHERTHGLRYSWFVVVRPDLVFLEPVPFSLATLLPDRIYVSSKEAGEPLGDYIYLVPRPLVSNFTRSLVVYNDAECDRLSHPTWPPEYAFHPYLDRVGMRHQVLPILFAVIRCSGEASCVRLRNEVFHNSLLRRRAHRAPMTAEQRCQALVQAPDFFPDFHPYLSPLPVAGA